MISQLFCVTCSIIYAIICTPSNAKPAVKMSQVIDAVPGEFPFIVSLRKGHDHICNGAIISSRHILTAAHCFINEHYVEGLFVITGATENPTIGEVHNVKNVTIHNGFKPNENNIWVDDIAVMSLTEPIIFDQLKNSIALPSTDTSGNFVASMLGWGNTTSYGKESECLRETKVAVLTNKHCNEKYTRIMETQMCGINGKGTGFCSGDSGSPLIYNNEVIGIVSFAASCENGHPDGYTRVFPYIDFISAAIVAT